MTQKPRIEMSQTRLIAGLAARRSFATRHAIPAQWDAFMSTRYGRIAGQVGETAYGVCANADGSGAFDYICGVEVLDYSGLADQIDRVRIPAGRYAVFTHDGPVSGIGETWSAIDSGLAAAGLKAKDGPTFELYDERFDPQSGEGIVEIWVPVR